MSRIGLWEAAVIILIILILFGAAKLPGLGKSLGKAVREFKKAVEKPGTKDDEDIR